MGVSQDAIDDARDLADQVNGNDGERVVTLWKENVPAYSVFTHCRWRTQMVAGAAGAVRIYEGIDAAEIASVCDLLGIDMKLRPDVLWGVRVMEEVAAPVFNRRME